MKDEDQQKKVDAELKNLCKLHALRDYLWENFDPKDPTYAALYLAVEQLIADKQDNIAILRGCDLIKNNKRKKYVFEVGRERIGAADVYLNGELMVSIFDEVVKVKPGDVIFSDIVKGRGSRIPDAFFVKTLLYSPGDAICHLSDKVKAVLDRDIPQEILEEQKRNLARDQHDGDQ